MKINKKFAAIATVTAVAVSGGVAFAYWSTGGSGTGNATAGTSASAVTLHSVFDAGLLLGHFETVTVKADGNGTDDVSLDGKTLKFTVTTDNAGCTAADFTLPDALALAGVVVHKNDSATTVGSSTLTMVSRDAVNQDGCRGALVTIDVATA